MAISTVLLLKEAERYLRLASANRLTLGYLFMSHNDDVRAGRVFLNSVRCHLNAVNAVMPVKGLFVSSPEDRLACSLDLFA